MKGKTFWMRLQTCLAGSTSDRYIFQSIFSSENLNDGKAAIPLIKGIDEHLPRSSLRYQTMNADYDYALIYEQVHRIGTDMSSLTIRTFPDMFQNTFLSL